MAAERTEAAARSSEVTSDSKFGIAMMFMVGNVTWYLPLCPVGTYRRIAQQAGLSLDYWPIRPMPATQAFFGLLTQGDSQAIISQSGSYRSERSFTETFRHPNRSLAIFSRIVLPHRDSLRTAQAVSDQVFDGTGRFIPVVVYPESPRDTLDRLEVYTKLVQPTPQEFGKKHVATAPDVETYLAKVGVLGFCFDTLHSRFLFHRTGQYIRTKLNSWTELFETVMRYTNLVHLSLGRSDVRRDGVNNYQDLVDLFNNNRDLSSDQIFTLLRAIKKSGYNGPYVFEAPASALERLTGQRMTPTRMAEAYKRLTGNLRDFLKE